MLKYLPVTSDHFHKPGSHLYPRLAHQPSRNLHSHLDLHPTPHDDRLSVIMHPILLQNLLDLVSRPGRDRQSPSLLDEPQDGDVEPHQPPPDYSELFPQDHDPDRQSCTPPSEMDPLVIAALHNQTQSPLHRLPNNILVLIIHMLDNSGVECLRRAGRRFSPLCAEVVLSRPRTCLPVWDCQTGPFLWPRFEQMCRSGQAEELMRTADGRDGLPADRTRLRRLLDRDRYCDGCREGAPGWAQRARELRRYLHCSGCGADHPACLFSRSQRAQEAHRRRCIGHEGYLRICSHEEGIVRRKDFMELERKSASKAPAAQTILQCKHSSHVILCAETSMEKGGIPNSDCLLCRDFIYPNFRPFKGNILMNWTAHLPLRRDQGPLTAAALRPRLATLRDNTGRFICPTLAPGMDLPELCCFDPNYCDCVPFKGSRNVDWQLLSRSGSKTGGHMDPANRLFLNGVLTHSGPVCEFALKRHETRLMQETDSCYGRGHSNIRVQPCHSGSLCLTVNYERRLRARSGRLMSPEWYQALDPESYGLTTDRDGFGIYWCRKKQCRNYYGRIPGYSRIIYGKEYSRKCPESCK